MNAWQFTPVAGLYFLAAGVSVLVACLSWRMRPVRGATYFSLLSMATGVWTLGYVLGFFNTNLAWKLIALRVEYLGITGSFFLWLLFACVYVYQDHWLTRRNVILLSIVPLTTFLLVLTIDHHQLFYRAYGLAPKNGLIMFTKDYSPYFYFWSGYAYLSLAAGGLFISWGVLRMADQFRGQAVPILLLLSVCMSFNLIYFSGHNPISPYDPTPLSFVVVGLGFIIIMNRYRFLDVVPVAYNLVFRNINTAVVIVDARRCILDMNPAAERVFDSRQRDALGKHILEGLGRNGGLINSRWRNEGIRTEIQIGGEGRVYELHLTPMNRGDAKDSSQVIMLFDISQLKWMAEQQRHLIGELERALTEVQQLSRKLSENNLELERLAVTDQLTGLYNRAKLDDLLNLEIQRTGRGDSAFALIMLDIDHFKKVNDTHGHQAGDRVLIEVSRALSGAVRRTDMVGRWGGEEFLIICPGTDAPGAARLAEKLRRAVDKDRFSHIGRLTISLGAATHRPGESAASIVARADQALYAAKNKGRNRVEAEMDSVPIHVVAGVE